MKIEIIGIRHIDFVDEKKNERVVGTSLYYNEHIPENEGIGKCPAKVFVKPEIQPGSYFDKLGTYDIEKWGNKIVKVLKV